MTAPIGFRRATIADRDAILALRQRLFGSVDPEKRAPAYSEWAFGEGYAGEGFVFLAEADDRVVGHLGFIAQRYVTPNGPADGALAVDAMVHDAFHRQHVFSGLARFAAEQLKKDVAFSIALQIRRASLGGMLAGGWNVIDTIPVMMKLHPLTAVRNLILRRRSAEATDAIGASHVRTLNASAIAELQADPGGANAQPRSAAFADWRFVRRPGSACTIHGWFDGDTLRAFVVHRAATLKGVPARAIVDAGSTPGGEADLARLIRHVCVHHRGGAAVVAALVSGTHPANHALARAGFFRGPYRFNLLAQVFDRRFDVAATAPWHLTWADTDHL